jgi:predicted ATPase
VNDTNTLDEAELAVSIFRLRNFKAVRDTGDICFKPLTAFVGNNGSGKSSVIEGLETLAAIADNGLAKAMQRWYGFEYIWNRSVDHEICTTIDGKPYRANPMGFKIAGRGREGHFDKLRHHFTGTTEITTGPEPIDVFFLKEELSQNRLDSPRRTVTRSENGLVLDASGDSPSIREPLSPDESVLYAEPSLGFWQFLRLTPEAMMNPTPVRPKNGYYPLAMNGSNIADYLNRMEPEVIEGIVETLQVVLPYLSDLQTMGASEIGRTVYLQMEEQGFKVPGWLFSTGTLRVVALLALFRNPEPPPLIVIEEIENGLDPRTIGLIVEEIREVVRTGKSQVIITTHSPYLLDLLPLESLIFVERVNGEPKFFRPVDDNSVRRWGQEFAPGQLYTMGRFRTTP